MKYVDMGERVIHQIVFSTGHGYQLMLKKYPCFNQELADKLIPYVDYHSKTF